MPRGGRRPGAGRKPKSTFLRSIDGGAGKRPGFPAAGSSTAVADIETFDPPASLSADERQVWLSLAPLAFTRRTLTRATALAFEMLCRNVVLERAMAASVLDRGRSDHRGMIQRLDAELLAFDLRPCGKAIYAPEGVETQTPANPLARFLKRAP